MSAHAVLAEGLVRRFGEVVAVDGVDLAVAPGEIYGFLGPNGAGKSTTVRMLCTLLAPTAGRATVGGFDVVDEPGRVRLHMGAALQDAALDDKLTGRELLVLQGRIYGLGRRERAARLDAVLPLVEQSALDRRIGTYSGGMKRRLDLAAALMHNPEILFLDEPTAGLDPASRQVVWEEVRRLRDEDGLTVFLTTQYLEEADELADRVGIIDHGRVVAEGPPDELKRILGSDVIVAQVGGDPARARDAVAGLPDVDGVEVRDTELVISTTHGERLVSPVAVALESAGAQVIELALRRPTLDDVFVELTGGHLEQNR